MVLPLAKGPVETWHSRGMKNARPSSFGLLLPQHSQCPTSQEDEFNSPSWVDPRPISLRQSIIWPQMPTWAQLRQVNQTQISRSTQLTCDFVRKINGCFKPLNFKVVCFVVARDNWCKGILNVRGILNVSWCKGLENAMLFPTELLNFKWNLIMRI